MRSNVWHNNGLVNYRHDDSVFLNNCKKYPGLQKQTPDRMRCFWKIIHINYRQIKSVQIVKLIIYILDILVSSYMNLMKVSRFYCNTDPFYTKKLRFTYFCYFCYITRLQLPSLHHLLRFNKSAHLLKVPFPSCS